MYSEYILPTIYITGKYAYLYLFRNGDRVDETDHYTRHAAYDGNNPSGYRSDKEGTTLVSDYSRALT